MFKNATVFKIAAPVHTMDAFREALAAAEFLPCGASQEASVGWVPPRGEKHGELVEYQGSNAILKLMIETRTVPQAAIKEAVKKACDQVEATTGRKPGKKERRELAEDARLLLLPWAFAKQAAVLVWIDWAKGLLVIDSASQSRTDAVTSALVKAIDGVAISYFITNVSPSALMTGWLAQASELSADTFHGFSIDRACQLKACDESKAVVTYTKHDLDTDEVRAHIRGGKYATKLALTFADRVSFTLTESGVLAGIKFLDTVFEGGRDEKVDQFDADVAITTGELGAVIKSLHDALDVQA